METSLHPPSKRAKYCLSPGLAALVRNAAVQAELNGEDAAVTPSGCSSPTSRVDSHASDEAAAIQRVHAKNISIGSKVRLQNMNLFMNGKYTHLEHSEGIVKKITTEVLEGASWRETSSATPGAVTFIWVHYSPKHPCLKCSKSFITLVRTWKKQERNEVKTKAVVSTPLGVGVVTAVNGQQIDVQMDDTSQVITVLSKDIYIQNSGMARLPPPVLSVMLLQHQVEAVNFMCSGPEARFLVLPMGGGKTFAGLSGVARRVQGLREGRSVHHPDLAIIMCPAALLYDVWMKAIKNHTSFHPRTWVFAPNQQLPLHASVMLLSYHTHLTDNDFRALIKGRILQVAIAEECAELRNKGKHWETARIVMQAARLRIGMAGIPISTEVKQMVHQLELLGYTGEYVTVNYLDEADSLAKMRRSGDLYWLEVTTMLRNIKKHPDSLVVPQHYPDAQIDYEPLPDHFTCGHSFDEYVVGCYMETLEATREEAVFLTRKENGDQMRARALIAAEMPKSKLNVIANVITNLFKGVLVPGMQQQQHSKFIVAAVFLRTLDMLQHVLRTKQPDLHQYRYDGSLSSNDRSKQLDFFTGETRPAILFLGADSGGLGLTILASCMIVAELQKSAKEYNQLRMRAIRMGNPKKVQVVLLNGPVQATRHVLLAEHREIASKLGLTLA